MEGNSNSLNPRVVPPQTIQEINKKLTEATVKLLGTSGPSNLVTITRDLVIPELSIEQQAIADAITPAIGADGQWWIGNQPTGVMASGYVTSPDGSVWVLSGISNNGTNPTYSKVFDPNAPTP